MSGMIGDVFFAVAIGIVTGTVGGALVGLWRANAGASRACRCRCGGKDA
jgi:hypothetical protein